MSSPGFIGKPKIIPVLDPNFRPAILEDRAYLAAVAKSGQGVPLTITLERGDGLISDFQTLVFNENSPLAETNFQYVERLTKTLLWARGGWQLTIGGSERIGEYLKKVYAPGGLREFDAQFMSRVYERPFSVLVTTVEQAPAAREVTHPIGRHLKGCRIGFDAGGSDRKVSAVIDGEAVYSEEVIWYPKDHSDPEYHYHEILKAMQTAATHMPKVDAIGVSAAGIYIDNRVMVASLFNKVPNDLFTAKIKNLFLTIQKEMGGVPLEVANDGDVTALAGAMELNDTNVLGLAMGTSEAGGYVDRLGNITGWLNELAFIPVDFNPQAPVDEWSGDYGCGVKYFSQDAVIRLAAVAGIILDPKLAPAEKLKVIQSLNEQGDHRARRIFESIGCYLGYAIAYYANFYDLKHLLILGRVTSGVGGNVILEVSQNVLNQEFPNLAAQINLHLPDESSRRVGQSIAAASLPEGRF